MLGKLLGSELAKGGLTHGGFAKKIGTKQQNVTRWVNGDAIPKAASVNLIADGLGQDRVRWQRLRAESEAQETPKTPPAAAVARELEQLRRELGRLGSRLEELEGRLAPEGGQSEPAGRRPRRGGRPARP